VNASTSSASSTPGASGRRARERSRRWEAADTVILAAIVLLIAVFAVLGFLVWQGYYSALKEAETKATNAAGVVADETQWVVGAARGLLTQMALASEAEPTATTLVRKPSIDAAAKALPADVFIAIYDAAGKVTPDGAADQLPANIADRDYFSAVAGGEDWALSAQEQDTATGEPVFAVAKRLVRNGAFAGVAVLAISDRVLEAFWGKQDLGPDSTISVVREDGWVIARYPPLRQAMNLGTLPVFKTLSAGEAGTYVSERSPADGVSRVVAFRHVPELNFIAIASVSRDAVLDNFWYAVRVVLLLMAPIAIALVLGSLWTARLLRQSLRAGRSLAAAVAHNEVLFREIHHRVKNNLQSVASLLQLQPIPREVKQEMGQRIAAMSAVHEHIYRSSSFDTVMVKDYLQTLIENIRAGADPSVRVVEEVANLPVRRDDATPLGLIVNEVVANAFKHAFADGREGVVIIRLLREEPGVGRLQVEDNGVGIDPDKPSKGIGRRLIAALVEQLGGEASFTSAASGSRFTLTFALAENAAEAA
jgi:two-component sensor histidine kinase